ncbi:MAG TPA: SDR family NAD(P)-dependent oxidoreductase [Acidimicrobiales bacterium]|jgi:benzil reductase ((S)-benzoin forming)
MTSSLIWISGASGGIGQALARNVPWPDTRVINISRSRAEGAEHLEADLSDPSSWSRVGQSFRRELEGFDGERVVFIQAAGMVDPIGFAGEVDTDAYLTNVVLNSAAPQALGHLFVAAARDVRADRHLVMLTSGAAKSVYPGWSSYGAAKAAADHWVRAVGAEQDLRGGGIKVLCVAPGTVDTGMQEQLRATSEDDFPSRQKFVDLHEAGKLADPDDVARDIWSLLDRGYDNGTVMDLRDLARDSDSASADRSVLEIE